MKQRAAAEDAKKPARTSKGLATRTRSTCACVIGHTGFHSCFEKPKSASAHLASAAVLLPPRAASESLVSSLSPNVSSLCKNAHSLSCNHAQSPRPPKNRGTLSRAPYGMPKTASSQNAIADCLPQACLKPAPSTGRRPTRTIIVTLVPCLAHTNWLHHCRALSSHSLPAGTPCSAASMMPDRDACRPLSCDAP